MNVTRIYLPIKKRLIEMHRVSKRDFQVFIDPQEAHHEIGESNRSPFSDRITIPFRWDTIGS